MAIDNTLAEPLDQGQVIAYQSARACVLALIAYRSEWRSAERRTPSPDEKKLALWTSEISQYLMELDALSIADHDAVDRIRREYGAEVKLLREQQQ